LALGLQIGRADQLRAGRKGVPDLAVSRDLFLCGCLRERAVEENKSQESESDENDVRGEAFHSM
jgi:hypothetical protein